MFPILLLVLFVAWFGWTTRKYATLGPTRRAPARIEPITPAHVHMPGGSVAPILAALGAGALFAGLILGGIWLALGALAMVVTLIVWFREGMRDYAHLEPSGGTAARQLPAVVVAGPPPGVHMPGPSIRPLMGALGSAALLGGLVVGGWVLILAVVFLVYTLHRLARRLHRGVPEGRGGRHDRPPREHPGPRAARAGTPGLRRPVRARGHVAGGHPRRRHSPTPAALAHPESTRLPGAGRRSARRRRQGRRLRQAGAQAPADAPFTITLTNEDDPTLPHDIDIREGPGAPTLQDQEPIPGGESREYSYDPLAAGTYQFFCSVHPGIAGMEGTLTVQ